MNWHRLSIPEVFELLGTTQQGLSKSTAEEKLLQVGPNELQEGKKKSIAGMLLTQFKDVMILILLAAAILSGIIGDLTDTIVILVIVLLNAILGFTPSLVLCGAKQPGKDSSDTKFCLPSFHTFL